MLSFCGITVAVAFNTGILTFSSAAAGQKDFRACALYRNRVLFLDTVLYLIISIPILWINEILLIIGQDPEVAAYAGKYIKIVWPSILFFFYFQAFAFFCSSIQRFEVPAIATFISSLLNIGLTYYFCNTLHWGFEGVCWAIFWNYTSRFIISALLIIFTVD